MASIAFPANIALSNFNIGLDTEENVTHVSLSGVTEVLTRTPGRWRGSLVIPQQDDAAKIRDVNRWMVDMSNPANYSQIPIAGFDTFDSSDTPAIASGPTLVSGRLQYVLSGDYGSLLVGHFVLVDDRLFMVTILSGANVVLVPEVQDIAATTSVDRAETLQALKDPETDFLSLPSTPDFNGPYAFAFIERRT